ncbi:MAG: polyprenyl synthetase family protein [Desulfobacteraceae bacterium]|jgi:octaprenyl-diphosphate synthase|nr:polyprenyl synthetase family protein [Desulfobacteraceae bacterium]
MGATEQFAGATDGSGLMAAIGPDLARIEQAMQADLATLTSDTDVLLAEVLRYGLFNGGKRIRPLLTVLCSRLCGGKNVDVVPLSIAFEYLHCATLFHDDVIDQALTRRGRPAINVAFGETAAILAGDFLHARSMLLVGRGGGVQALEIFCGATTAMVDGEFLQLHNASNYNLAEADYFAVIMGKTARLIGATCEIGALVAGAAIEEQQALNNYGLHLGCAFQIIDDLLDYLGDEAKTGKSVGNDFREGKMTLPLIIAIGRAEEKDRERLLAMLTSVEARTSGFTEASALIARYDGFALARQKAETIIADALVQLRIFDQDAVQRELAVLEGLAYYVLNRKK